MADLCPVAVGSGNEGDENQPETAGESYLKALKQMKLCDVVFTFENCDDRIEAHQLFLRLRSPVFFAMFRGQGANVGKTKEVEISGVSPQRFQEFLEFMYADRFEANIAGALDLLHLGHKYKVNPLIKKCEEVLKMEIKVQDAVHVFEAARKYQNAELEQKAGDIMAKNMADIPHDDDFLNAQEDTLVYLLERDDIIMDEIDLFRLVVKWGENKLTSAPKPADLKTVLVNLLPLVRFTSMTPEEFASEVVPWNLLTAQETIAVYSYFASNEAKRQSISALLKFNVKPRKSEETDSLVWFYEERSQGTNVKKVVKRGQHPLKECLSFFPIYEVLPKLWQSYSSRRPAITGILIHTPACIGLRFCQIPNFKLSIKWSAGEITDLSLEQRFQKELFPSHRILDQVAEISVEPPVELISGGSICITVEDKSDYFSSNGCSAYSQNTAASGSLNQSLRLPLKSFPLQLKKIQRNTALSGFADASYAYIRVIQGIRIGLV